MSSSWLAYLFVSLLTGSPWMGLLAAAAIAWGAEGWFRGRIWSPLPWFQRWKRIRDLRDTIAANPHDATAKAQLGGLIVDRSPAEAKALLEDVHARYPDMAHAAYHLGVARLRTGDLEGGRAMIEHALKLKRDLLYGEPAMRMGDALRERGDWKNAIAWYERVLDVHRSSAEAWYKIGRAALVGRDPERARRAFGEALAIGRGSPAFKRRLDRPWRVRAWFWSTFRTR